MCEGEDKSNMMVFKKFWRRPPARLARGVTKFLLSLSDPRPHQARGQAVHDDLLCKASDLPHGAEAQLIEGPHNTTPSPLIALIVRHPLLRAPLGRARVILRVLGPAP